MICDYCHNFYLIPTRRPLTCQVCEPKLLTKAIEAEVSDTALPFPDLAAWCLSGQPPRVLKPVWRTE